MYLTAWTRRHTSATPVTHAIDDALPFYSRTGKTYRAVCGTQVRFVDRKRFDAGHERACAACCRKLRGSCLMTGVTLRWRRTEKLSGPGNLLNDRFEVFHSGTIWRVRDRSTGIVHAPRQTMRAARAAAEEMAQRFTSP